MFVGGAGDYGTVEIQDHHLADKRYAEGSKIDQGRGRHPFQQIE